ncbi:MAG TPA: GntR family transcriptional regulator [Terrimesophilobacter sp.]|uniref:GntR family transcriptional regulator n=1 Tax=Terrimesophilobacter sp. TaxID=2906435 RepID=UPI002F91CB68
MTNSRPSLTRRQLSDQAASHLRALVMSGSLTPGEGVRPEIVGAKLGMSTTPAREALLQLRAEGFLELSPGKGFTVAPLTGNDVRDLFTVQALIAGELAARAARGADENSVRELEEIHRELERAAHAGDTEALEQLNHDFHRHVNRLAGSRKVLWALGLLTRYVPREFYGSIAGWPEATMDGHGRVLDSIRAGEPEAARAAMSAHIIHSGELLASHFDRVRNQANATQEPDERAER